jgi:hypothetical protein
MKLRAAILALGLAILTAGCGGGGGVPIEGKVTKGGQAYSPAADGDLNIGLTAVDGGKNFSSKVGEDGSFKIADVPSGKYSVNVTQYPKAGGEPSKKGPPTSSNKKLDEQWDVSSSNKSFTLDVAKLK